MIIFWKKHFFSCLCYQCCLDKKKWNRVRINRHVQNYENVVPQVSFAGFWTVSDLQVSLLDIRWWTMNCMTSKLLDMISFLFNREPKWTLYTYESFEHRQKKKKKRIRQDYRQMKRTMKATVVFCQNDSDCLLSFSLQPFLLFFFSFFLPELLTSFDTTCQTWVLATLSLLLVSSCVLFLDLLCPFTSSKYVSVSCGRCWIIPLLSILPCLTQWCVKHSGTAEIRHLYTFTWDTCY